MKQWLLFPLYRTRTLIVSWPVLWLNIPWTLGQGEHPIFSFTNNNKLSYASRPFSSFCAFLLPLKTRLGRDVYILKKNLRKNKANQQLSRAEWKSGLVKITGQLSKQKAQSSEQLNKGEQDLVPHQPLEDSENTQNCGPKAFNRRCEEQPPPRSLGVLAKNPLPA